MQILCVCDVIIRYAVFVTICVVVVAINNTQNLYGILVGHFPKYTCSCRYSFLIGFLEEVAYLTVQTISC